MFEQLFNFVIPPGGTGPSIETADIRRNATGDRLWLEAWQSGSAGNAHLFHATAETLAQDIPELQSANPQDFLFTIPHGGKARRVLPDDVTSIAVVADSGIGTEQSAGSQMVQVPQPAPGVDWSIAVPQGQAWRVKAGRFVFNTSAVVGNRTVKLVVTMGGQEVFRSIDQSTIAASATRTYSIIPSGAFLNAQQGNSQFLPVPQTVWLPAGSIIGSLTTAIDAADQYSGITLIVETATGQIVTVRVCDAEAR